LKRKQINVVDVDGFIVDQYVVTVNFDNEGNEIPLNLPEDHIEKPTDPTKRIYKHKWDSSLDSWVEGATTEEIEQIKQTPIPSNTNEELKNLKAQNAEILLKLVMKGVM
jgi:hypothetical protein